MTKKLPLSVLVFGFSIFTACYLFAEVPNRITYQGRLSKSGVGAAGKHIFVANIVNEAGTLLWSSGNREINVPATGDFSLVLEPTLSGSQWLTNSVKLEISVDGEKLSPTDSFSSSPYALVAKEAQSVMANGVTTVSIASGAVTNDKLAENLNLSPSKVLMYSGIEGSFTLASWLAAGTTGLIDAAKIKGNLTAQYDEVAGTAVVRHANFQQYIRPTMNVVPLTIASLPEGTTSVFEIRDKNGNMSVKVSENGYVGVGTDAPTAPLEVNGNAQTGTVVPSVASAYNLGASTNPWANVYADTVTASHLGVTTLNVSTMVLTNLGSFLGYKVGTFTSSAGTGTQSITGIGFKPRFVILTFGDGGTDSARGAIGFFTPSNQLHVFSLYVSAADTAGWGTDATRILTAINGDASFYASCSYVSMDADGFTINWTVAHVINVGYVAFQ